MMCELGFGKHKAWQRAMSLSLKLGSPLFKVWLGMDPEAKQESEYFLAWKAFQDAAESFMKLRGTKLPESEALALGQACRVAHELAHDNLPGDVPDVLECSCEIAELVKELLEVMRAGMSESEAAA